MALDQYQQAAVDKEGARISVVAPAGSGKTSCLTEAVKKYYNENELDNIVVLTYTVEAAKELRERLGNTTVRIGTIHSWAGKKISEYAKQYNFRPMLLPDDEIMSFVETQIRRRGYRVNSGVAKSYILGNVNMQIPQTFKNNCMVLKADYEQYKKKNGLYDFTQLPEYLEEIIKEYEIEIDDVDALFVDEYQDVDDAQASIFDAMLTKKKFIIGDNRQSIYMFRGAKGLVGQGLGFTECQLKRNYRSYQEIVNVADYFYTCASDDIGCPAAVKWYLGAAIKAKHESDIEAHRGNGAMIAISNGRGDISHSISCSEKKVDVKDIKKNYRVLCRTNKEVKALTDAGFDASTIHQTKGREYDNVCFVEYQIKNGLEDINLAYVALTRAKNKLYVVTGEELLPQLRPRRY